MGELGEEEEGETEVEGEDRRNLLKLIAEVEALGLAAPSDDLKLLLLSVNSTGEETVRDRFGRSLFPLMEPTNRERKLVEAIPSKFKSSLSIPSQ